MKLTTVIVGLLFSTFVFAAPAKNKAPASATTTEAPAPMNRQEAARATGATTSTASAPRFQWEKTEPKVHFSTSLVGLFSGKTNVNANFFATDRIALSVSYQTSSEKTGPIKKNNPELPAKVTVSTSQFGVGAAYYFYPITQKWNLLANPYMVSERKEDPQDNENGVGFGAKADALYLLNNIALNGGAQVTTVSGSTDTTVNAGVGYIF